MTQIQTLPLWPEGCEHDVTMAHGRPRVEIYQPDKSAAAPNAAVIVCPGGGYHHNAPHEGKPFAELFAAHGITGIICWYRVHPHGWPAPYADVARAIRMVRANAKQFNIDPDRLGLMGFSAGGHNAATVATQPDLHHDPLDDLTDRFSARPDRLILGYPVISFVSHYHAGSCEGLLGPDADVPTRRQFSNELQVTAANPPTFIMHTDEDAGVPAENVLMFATALRARNVSVELHLFRSGPHGQGLAAAHPQLKIWPQLMLNWLDDWTR